MMMEQEILRVGLLGYGAIGQDVARLLAQQNAAQIRLIAALVRHADRKRPPGSPQIVATLPELLAEHPQVVVEVAGHEGVREHAATILRHGVDLILVSVGALADTDLFENMQLAMQQGASRLTIASGAIGGLDALAAASLGGLTSVVHILHKPPATLLPPQEAASCTTAQEIFRGSARKAAQHFPEFLNVAAAVALAGNGFDRTEVRVIADPTINHSLHTFRAEGTFGVFQFTIENAPLTHPPRGARLVAMSIVHTLLLRSASFMMG